MVEPGGYGTTFMDALVRPSDRARDGGYGPMAAMPEKGLTDFAAHVKGPQGPDPQWVADAVAGLVKLLRGKRPFRTTVDRLGMGAAVDPYNRAAEDLQRQVYTAFGMADLLTLKT